MAQRIPLPGTKLTHTRLTYGANWVIPLLAIGAPAIGRKALNAENLLAYMQCVLLLLYGLQIVRLWSDGHTLATRHSVRRGLAAEAARLYFAHMRASYLESGVKVLVYTIAVNVLVLMIEPRNMVGVLWLLMAPMACFSMVSLRMIVCHRSVQHGSFGADDRSVHELAEFLLSRCAGDTPSGRGYESRLPIESARVLGIRGSGIAGIRGVRTV